MHALSASIPLLVLVAILSVALCSIDVLTSPQSGHHPSLSSKSSNSDATLAFLQNELAATSAAQQSILKYLTQSHLVPIGMMPRSLSHLRKADDENYKIHEAKSRIVMSTKDNNIECRIALGRAPLGSKCVSPCGCIGSQKWIQFKELNTLRRKDPAQWTICQTCQQKFEYDIFSSYGGLLGNLIGMVLDNTSILRTGLFVLTSIVVYTLSLGDWMMRGLVSRPFWQMYPHWSKITHLPLALKFWFGKIVFQIITDYYVACERNIFLSYLVDIETSIIESKLPVESDIVDGLTGGLDEDDDSDSYNDNSDDDE